MSRRFNLCRNTLFAIGVIIVCSPHIFAQTPAAHATASAASTAPAYDVASIKPDKSGSGNMRINVRDDSFSATNVSVKMLLVDAYDIKEYLISGGPKWVESAHFDIHAKVTDFDPKALKDLSNEQRQAMLRPLLADRFQLKVHMETKILPVYDMVLTKDGPKFKLFTPDGGKTKFNGIAAFGMYINNGQLTGHGVPLSTLANSLSYQLNRTVVDKTGLTGKYDISLSWAPDNGPDNSPESSAASLFTALPEQLGLKLQSAKGPVETLVIDHIEMPSEN